MRLGRRRGARIAAGVLTVLFGAGLLLGFRLRRIERLGGGVTAKQLCSCIFVDGRGEAACRSDLPPFTDPIRAAVDATARTVRTRGLLLGAERMARYRDGSGCTLQ
jgi:hypothetical protein